MKPRHSVRSFPLHLHIATLFVGLLVLFAAVSNWYQYRQSSEMMLNAASSAFRLIGQRTEEELADLYQGTASLVELLARQRLAEARTLEQRLDNLGFMVTGMQHQPLMNALYMGYSDGEFFLLRRWTGEASLQALFNPPADTAWIVQSIEINAGKIKGEYLYFGQHERLLERRDMPGYRFDPRVRPWYQAGQEADTLHVGEPGVFFTTRRVGISFSRRSVDQRAVAGADITLESIDQLLMQSKITLNTQLALVNQAGEVLSSHQGSPELHQLADGQVRLPTVKDLGSPVLLDLMAEATRQGRNDIVFEVDREPWQGLQLRIALSGTAPLTLLLASPQRELLSRAYAIRDRGLLIALLLLCAGVLVAVGFSVLVSRPLRQLATEAHKIERFEFDQPVQVRSHITEAVDLAAAMDGMKSTIRRFLELSQAIAGEPDFQKLLRRLLTEMLEVSGASGGLLYLADAEGHKLEVAMARWQEQAIDSDLLFAKVDLDARPQHPLSQALHTPNHTQDLKLLEMREHFTGLDAEDRLEPTLLALPLHNRDGELLGALALFIDTSQQPLSAELQAFCEALSTTAAVALNTQRLLDEQKILLEAFIQLIAGAIDAKSPYTGGHCQRVPELTKMLAQAACAAHEGPFVDFDLSTEQWEELRIAAWLHDCGKVTTPEYVVDKATKLETLYDRIHEIRMRFEVLKRDAEIASLRAILDGANAAQQQTALANELARLDDDFSFIAQCNQGGESMAQEQLERLQRIAKRHWLRSFSDRIGISHEELQRKQQTGEEQLPVQEALLADKPEHLFPRRARERIEADNPWGFRLSVPEYLYNRGELYNLSICRGTLAAEDRYKINEHIVQTIIMLEQLPFPKHLRRVPEIAGGHHEKMDGSGYPKKLRREQMSLPARMIAIADIFEALTAVDRPYKKGKLLSEAISIMSRMKQEQHIDPQLFDLFLRSGVYLTYAKRYLQPEQIDAVDIRRYLE